ncbi:MAG: tRNA 2-selenouridine(34) synthase MnmH [Cytophagales bacterium]|nr:tRNA 2-selenouridine(34) synthase MnmH [Cytophagales bacterium]
MKLSLVDFLALRERLPVLDVRSQDEFSAGHIPGAVNEPLLTNDERSVVGTTYKKAGQQEAILEGFRLVGPRLSDIVTNTKKVSGARDVLVYCWRGGMRSENFSQFIGMAGIRSRVLDGGYKTYRRAAMDAFRRPMNLITITGCTGSGKSDVLRELAVQGEQVLDLEALANHKGSAFGGLLQPPQPTTEQFQNDVYEVLLKFDLGKRVWVEDESIAIGKIFLPGELWTQMNGSPLVQMDVEKEVRVERLVVEYGPADRGEFAGMIDKVSKKLGGQHAKTAKEKLLQGDMTGTIAILLTYYDKAYLRSIERRKSQIQLTVPWNGKNMNSFVSELTARVDSLLVT